MAHMAALSIFKSESGKKDFLEAYDRCLELWGVPYETTEVETEFGTTHVIVSGPEAAPPLVLLHGMTFNSTMWYRNVPALSGKYRVYCLDTIGDLGKSVVARPLKSRQDAARWLGGVLDGLGLDKVDLAGHSLGGWLSLNFALAAPERVNSLMLLAPVASILRVPLAFMVKVYPVMLRPTREKILRLWRWFLSGGNRLEDELQELIVQGWLHCRPRLNVIPGVFRPEEVSGMAVRTLFVVGEDEVIYPAGKAVKRVKERFRHAQAEIVPGANHCLPAEQPEAVNRIMMEFLTGR